MPVHSISIDGLQIQYLKEGEVPNLLLLHGWGGNKESFLPLKEFLIKHYRVIIPDFPGFGESDEPKKSWEVTDYANFIEKFIKKCGIEGCFVFGHSFGGRVVIKLASRTPKLFTKMILCSCAGIKPKLTWKHRIIYVLAKIGKLIFRIPGLKKISYFAKKLLYKLAGTQDYNKTSGIMRETFKRVIEEDLRILFKTITVPTLLFWGDMDTITPLGDGKIMEKEIKGAKLIVLKGGKHGIHKDMADKIYPQITAFFK